MVEAAIVFPLVVLTVAALIQILVFFYQLTEVNVKMHLALRAESGSLSKTIQYRERESPPYPIYRKGSRLYYSVKRTFLPQGILRQIHKELWARQYINREAAAVRGAELAARITEQE